MNWTLNGVFMLNYFDFESRKVGEISLAKRKPVLGVGINDCDHVVNIAVDGKTVLYKPYLDWLNMLKRCYCESYHKRKPSYRMTKVCDDWLFFSKFKKWHKDNYNEGFFLDKDILSDLNVYCPSSCVFVPVHINNFITNSEGSRGELPVGVSLTKSGSYHSYCRNPFTKKRVNIGHFKSAIEAQEARLEYKLKLVFEYKDELDEIDTRLYERIVLIIKRQK